MTMYIRPYKRGSSSAKLLRLALQITNVKESTVFKDGDVLLNWGGVNALPSTFDRDTMLCINNPREIAIAVSKVDTLRAISDYTGIYNKYFTSKDDLEYHFRSGLPAGVVIYCRTLTRASRGRGIVVAKSLDEVVEAPLYTYAYPCKREYRVHVFNGEVIDLVAKVKITDKSNPKYVENADQHIRNSETGYVFARNAVKVPDRVRSSLSTLSINAVEAVGLTFGAVDIVRDIADNYNVLEVNSAPGIMGTALAGYVDSINKIVSSFLGELTTESSSPRKRYPVQISGSSSLATSRPADSRGYTRSRVSPLPWEGSAR